MIEIVFALLLISNNQITEHRIQDSMSQCLKGKRIAMRNNNSKHIEYHCLKAKVETEIYMGEKSIRKIIVE